MLSMFMDEKHHQLVTYPGVKCLKLFLLFDLTQLSSTDQSVLILAILAIWQSAGHCLAIGYGLPMGWLLASYGLSMAGYGLSMAGYGLTIKWPWAGYGLSMGWLSDGYGLAMGWLWFIHWLAMGWLWAGLKGLAMG